MGTCGLPPLGEVPPWWSFTELNVVLLLIGLPTKAAERFAVCLLGRSVRKEFRKSTEESLSALQVRRGHAVTT